MPTEKPMGGSFGPLLGNVQQIFDDHLKSEARRHTRELQQWMHGLDEQEIANDLKREGFDYGAHTER